MREALTMLAISAAVWALAGGAAAARCDLDDPAASARAAAERRDDQPRFSAPVPPSASRPAPAPRAERHAPPPRAERREAIVPQARGAAIPDSALMRKRRIL